MDSMLEIMNMGVAKAMAYARLNRLRRAAHPRDAETELRVVDGGLCFRKGGVWGPSYNVQNEFWFGLGHTLSLRPPLSAPSPSSTQLFFPLLSSFFRMFFLENSCLAANLVSQRQQQQQQQQTRASWVVT